ncbi:unnamed protein product [Rhizophagus irregularis]|nr:unnamed protein product [Rhizophagus irregularis]
MPIPEVKKKCQEISANLELEQCYRTISLQYNTIIAHEKEVEKLKSEISDLRKQLRVLQRDKKFKDEVGSIQDGRIIELENEIWQQLILSQILIKAERDQYQNLLHVSIQRVDNLRNQFTDSGNQNLRLQRLLDESQVQAERTARERDNAQGERNLAILAYNNEKKESRHWYFSYRDKDRRVQGLLREKFAKQLLYQRDTNRLQQNTQRLQTNAQNQVNRMLVIIARKQTRIGELLREKFVFQLVIKQRDQNILNLQQQILALQNNPPQNMAAVHEIYQMLAPALGQVPNYIGKETPDEYIQKITNIFESAGAVITAANNANANTFVDAQKCDILKSKMGDKFSPVPANDPYTGGNPAINSPATFTVWLRHKYREVMAGNAELALQSLIQERFNQGESPDVYESRTITIGNQIQPQVSSGATSADFEKLNTKIASLEAQLAESMQVHSKLAQRLQLPENVVNSNNASIFDSCINQELEKRLGVIKIKLAKLTNLIREDTIDTKSARYQYSESSDYNNRGLEKRIEQIEAHLAKFAKKDTKGAKTPQRQCSEFSPFGGLEKRLDQIESLIAKLVKESKSRSGRIHMATVDKQSNPIFSDDDTSKPEDNDYNSDSSSAVNYAEQSGHSNKSSKSKVSNKSELRKVKQDINTSSTHNASSEKGSQGKRVSLEETIHKIIQSVFENYLPYIIQQVKKREPALAQHQAEKDSDDEFIDGPIEIDFVQRKEPATDVVTVKCKIKRLVIPAGTVDPGANFPIMSEDISK